MQQLRVLLLAAAIVMAPLGARGADLVVWWEKGQIPQSPSENSKLLIFLASCSRSDH